VKTLGAYNLSNKIETQKIIENVLVNSCLNRAQIKKMFTVQLMTENRISLKVDLHGLNLEESKDIINRLFNTRKLHIVVIEVVHGYKRGTVLKDYFEKDFSHDRLEQGRHRLCNEGATKLYLRPWKEASKEEIKPRIKLKKPNKKSNSTKEQGQEDVANNALFRLTMIKEKVKAATISGSFTYEGYNCVLNDEQIETLKPLLELSLTKEEFLLRILNVYVFQETLYVDVNVNKLKLTQVTTLLNKLISLKCEHHYIMLLHHKNKRCGVLNEYLVNTSNDKAIFESHVNNDHTITTIKFLK